MTESYVKFEEIGPQVIQLTLQSPNSLNALSSAGLREFRSSVERVRQSPDVRVLVITGSGKAFCAGADLKEIQNFTPESAREFSLFGHQTFSILESLRCPVVAALNGHAMGGGLELACSCDLIWASTDALLGQPENKVGMISGWGGTFRLAERVGVGQAKQLLFTARAITAEEALRIGLVDKTIPAETFSQEVQALCREIASNAPLAVRLSKSMVNRYRTDRQKGAAVEAQALFECVVSDDQTEGVIAFLGKRRPKFSGR